MTATEAPAPAALDPITAQKMEALYRAAIHALNNRAAERAASGLRIGDRVTIKAGGYAGDAAKITGVNHLGAWEVTTDSGIPLAFSSKVLARVVLAEVPAA